MALTDNIIEYWKLDESSGNAIGAVSSTSLTNNSITYSTGKINNGASGGGSSSLNGTISSNLGGSYTIAFWFKLTNDDANEYAFLESHVASYNNYWIYINKTGGKKLAYNVYDGTNNPVITGGTSLTNNTWYFATIVRDTVADKMRLYLNGSSDATEITDTTTSTPTYSNFVLLRRNNNTVGLNGMMDEVGLWSRALDSTEISQLYNSGAGLQYPFTNFIPRQNQYKNQAVIRASHY